MHRSVRHWTLVLATLLATLAVLTVSREPSTRATTIRYYIPVGVRGPAQDTPHPTHVHFTATVPHPTQEPPTPEPSPTESPCPTHLPPPTSTPHAAPVPIVVVPRAIESAEWFHDTLEIKAVSITGDTLSLSVTYGGGCWVHDLWLVASSLFMESAPPQVDVFLGHNAYGDLCRAIVHRDLTFDLAPLKRTATNGSDTHGTLILRIRGWEERVQYDY
jgi:hypothetical protein